MIPRIYGAFSTLREIVLHVIKPRILFFARGYQAGFYPLLRSEAFESVYVTLTRAEKRRAQRMGAEVVACFEEDIVDLVPMPVPPNYLQTSFSADRFLGRFDHEDRMEILGREIAFWRNLLDRYRPIAVMNEIVAIEISEVLLIETQRRSIRYLAPMRSLVDEHFYWIRNPISLSGRHLEARDPGPTAKRLAADYMSALRQKDFRPGYVRNLKGRLSPRPLLAALAKFAVSKIRERRSFDPRGRFRYETYAAEYAKRVEVFVKGILRRYDSISIIPEDREIIFYPLHQEPEATLNYMSEFHSNQAATIENILKAMAPNQVLVVKEHPVDKGSLLRRKFWEIRRNSSALYFLPGEMSGREILARVSRLVTLTSTVGWEAANLGTPVYVLGQIFYDHLPGVTRIGDYAQLRDVLRQPVSHDHRLDPTGAEHFVASMIERSYPGDALPFARLHSEENVRRVIHAISDALDL